LISILKLLTPEDDDLFQAKFPAVANITDDYVKSTTPPGPSHFPACPLRLEFGKSSQSIRRLPWPPDGIFTKRVAEVMRSTS
jgi:hypothetical protein